MSRVLSNAKSFLVGSVSVIAIAVLLIAFGVVPVKTEKTTVVKQQTVSEAATTSAALSGGSLTPEQSYRDVLIRGRGSARRLRRSAGG